MVGGGSSLVGEVEVLPSKTEGGVLEKPPGASASDVGFAEGDEGLDAADIPLSSVRAKSITPEFVDALRLLIFKATKTTLGGQRKYEWLQKFVTAVSSNRKELNRALEQCAQSDTVALSPHESASFRRCLAALIHEVFPDEAKAVSRPRVLYGLLRPLATAMSTLRTAPAPSAPPPPSVSPKHSDGEEKDPSGDTPEATTKPAARASPLKSSVSRSADLALEPSGQDPHPRPSELVSLRSLAEDDVGVKTPSSCTQTGADTSIGCAAPTKSFPKERTGKGGGGGGRSRARWSPDQMGGRSREKHVSPPASPTCARSLSFESPDVSKGASRGSGEEIPIVLKAGKDSPGARGPTHGPGRKESPQGQTPTSRYGAGRGSPESGMSPLLHLLQRQAGIGVGSSPFKQRDVIVRSAFGRTVRDVTTTPWRRYTSVSDGSLASWSGGGTVAAFPSGASATPTLDTICASPRRCESFSSFRYSSPSRLDAGPSPLVNRALVFEDSALAIEEAGDRFEGEESSAVTVPAPDLLQAQAREKLRMLEEHINLAARAQAEVEGRRQQLDAWEKRLLERQVAITEQEQGLAARERELMLKEQELVLAEENQMRLGQEQQQRGEELSRLQRSLDDKTAALAMERSALSLRAKGLDAREVDLRRAMADVRSRETKLSATTQNISKWYAEMSHVQEHG